MAWLNSVGRKAAVPHRLQLTLRNDLGPTPFEHHFKSIVQQAVLDKSGEPNAYFCPNFIPKLLRYFLPQAVLWSGLLLGDLGRHGKGPLYAKVSQRYQGLAQKTTQNYTRDNMTQGIMEKSQWDLKKVRFQQKRLTRLDNFVYAYKVMHDALLREYQDSLKTKTKDMPSLTSQSKHILCEEHGKPSAARMPDKVKKLSVELSQSMEICVWKADLEGRQQPLLLMDGVVNAANENLQHYGGLALALSKAGG
ncbi:hypothetical protein L3Q82_016358 [Scortum barcoo]|uniref:Uncharacterized protein n=1 Tax=Scortum barcoo TaxID=214431 RepID=A0ACB8X7A5_9TELE|nr:hypothetical protein L3Q82_016358 [Scortum barcoo]